MAHKEIDYSKMADKYESRYPGKNLDSPRVFSSRPYVAYGEAFISITRNMIR